MTMITMTARMMKLRTGVLALLITMSTAGLNAIAAPIHDAASAGDAETVYQLIREYPTMLELRDKDGASPLYKAALNGRTELVRGLIAMNAEVTVATADGLTPLHWTALHGDLEICRMLLDAGADVNARSTVQANTPLHEVWGGGHVEVAKLLIERGADINAVEKWYGMTILHYAADHGKPELVRTLLEAGADPTFRAENGRTAVDMARDDTSRGILKLAVRPQSDQ